MNFKIFHHHHPKGLGALLPDQEGEAGRRMRRVLITGLCINFILMGLKLTAGYLGHSDALRADGFHSLNDVASDIIMFIFIGLSLRPADSRYSFGYGKFETFAAMLMAFVLVCISVAIAAEGIESIIAFTKGETLPQPDIWTFVVVLFAIAVKEGLFRFYSATGRRIGSVALVANAWHHRSDAMASIATLIGVTFAHFFGEGFRILDPVASLVIALFIFIPALRMAIPAFLELMDRSMPESQVRTARKAILSIKGIEGIDTLRCRRQGHRYIFDTVVEVAPNLTVEDCSEIYNAVEEALKCEFCPHIMLSMTTIPAR